MHPLFLLQIYGYVNLNEPCHLDRVVMSKGIWIPKFFDAKVRQFIGLRNT